MCSGYLEDLSSLTLGYLDVITFASTQGLFTYLSVTDTQFSLVLIIEYALYNFNYSKLVEDWFQTHLGQCPMSS